MKTRIIILFITSVFIFSCNKSNTKDKINEVGDATGQVLGEFVKGVSSGVENAFDVKIDLPQNLIDKGFKLGKCSVMDDSLGTDNLLVVYIIFEKDYEGKITSKAFDNQGLEMGRTSTLVLGKKDEARFFDFHFDKRTNIDGDSKITVE